MLKRGQGFFITPTPVDDLIASNCMFQCERATVPIQIAQTLDLAVVPGAL